MEDDKLGFLAEQSASEPPAEPQAEPKPAPAPTPAPADGPERAADGRFVAKDSEPAPKPPPVSPPVEPGHVPISALLEEREKRQAAEKARAEADAKWAEIVKANQPPPTPGTDLGQALYQQNLRVSRRFAEKAHGPELVQQAHDWVFARCAADPLFNERMRSSEDPYEDAVQAYKREAILAKVSPDRLAEFEAWEAAQAQAAQAQPKPEPSAVAPPPRSLANAPSAGGKPAATPVGPGAAFEAAARLFN